MLTAAEVAERPGLTLTTAEIEQLTGYKQPSRQIKALHLLGYFRARISPRTGGVVLERAHYHAVAEGRTAASGETTRPRPRVRQPSHA